jgi:hypothetical protein
MPIVDHVYPREHTMDALLQSRAGHAGQDRDSGTLNSWVGAGRAITDA